MSKISTIRPPFSTMPRGTAALFFIQIFATLSYSVLYSSLVLYMRSAYGMSIAQAASITGVFIAYNYSLHLLGGYLAGRYLSYRSLFCLGMAAQVVGCLLFMVQTKLFFFLGLSAFLTGCGLNVTCVNCMVIQLFSPEDNRREKAFMYNYAAMNGGFFIGYSMAGYFHIIHNYSLLFCLSALGNAIAIALCFSSWDALADKKTLYARLSAVQKRMRMKVGLVGIALLYIALNGLLHTANLANQMVLVSGVLMLVAMIALAYQQNEIALRRKLLAFTILTLAALIFWTLFQTAPMGLNIFIDKNVNRNIIWMGVDWTIPPQWFQNINALVIIVGGPLLSAFFVRWRAKGKTIHVPAQFCMALLLIGLAFMLLPVGIHYADAQGLVNPKFIIGCYVLQSIGELLIAPVGYAMIGALVPASMQGLMTGVWMMSTGVAATLSSYSSRWMTSGVMSENPIITNAGYANVFALLGASAIVASVALYFLIPFLKSYMNITNKTLSDSDVVALAE